MKGPEPPTYVSAGVVLSAIEDEWKDAGAGLAGAQAACAPTACESIYDLSSMSFLQSPHFLTLMSCFLLLLFINPFHRRLPFSFNMPSFNSLLFPALSHLAVQGPGHSMLHN